MSLLAKVAAIRDALGLPADLAAGPMLAAACEAMGIQPGQGATLPAIDLPPEVLSAHVCARARLLLPALACF